jgi:carbon monoxide dehydrogenase subunit G
MNATGEHRLSMARQTVWDALMDPDVLAKCIPGCESLERISPDAFRAKVALVVGPVRATFETDLMLGDLNPPARYRLTGAGRGGAVGFGQGHADVELEELEPAVTLLRYTAAFQVGGRLAQLGSRLVQATTKKLADDFFAALVAEIEAREPVGDVDRDAETGEPQQAKSTDRRALVKWIAVAAAAGAMLSAWLIARS